MDRKISLRRIAAVLIICLFAAGAVVMLPAAQIKAEAAATTGLVKKGGKTYFYKYGKPITNRWKTVKGKTYYFGENGAAVKGWNVLKKSGKYQLFWFSSKGILNKKKAKNVPQSCVHSIAVKSDKLLKKWGITKETAKADAIAEIFSHLSNPAEYIYARDTGSKSKYWSYRYGKEMLSKKAGSCYHYASAFGFLVKRATKLPVRICRGKAQTFTRGTWQPHAWAEVKLGGTWYIYDPNAKAYSKLTNIQFVGLKVSASGSWYKAENKETIYM